MKIKPDQIWVRKTDIYIEKEWALQNIGQQLDMSLLNACPNSHTSSKGKSNSGIGKSGNVAQGGIYTITHQNDELFCAWLLKHGEFR